MDQSSDRLSMKQIYEISIKTLRNDGYSSIADNLERQYEKHRQAKADAKALMLALRHPVIININNADATVEEA